MNILETLLYEAVKVIDTADLVQTELDLSAQPPDVLKWATSKAKVLLISTAKKTIAVSDRDGLKKFMKYISMSPQEQKNQAIIPAPGFQVSRLTITAHRATRFTGETHDGKPAVFNSGWGDHPKKAIIAFNNDMPRSKMVIIPVGKNPVVVNAVDVAVIHDKTVDVTKALTTHEVITQDDGRSSFESKHKILVVDGSAIDRRAVKSNPAYHFINTMFEDITDAEQVKSGPYIFDLAFMRPNDKNNWSLWIYENGYVRVNRGVPRAWSNSLAVIAKPEGDTPTERFINAWKNAEEWAKDFLKRKDKIK